MAGMAGTSVGLFVSLMALAAVGGIPQDPDDLRKALESLEVRLEQRMSKIENSFPIQGTGALQRAIEALEGLEKRIAAIEMISATQDTRALEALEGLGKRMSAMEKIMRALQPQKCEPGMGEDENKLYPKYVILINETMQKNIWCDTKTDGGGWLVIQRRAKGDVDFNRNWTSYREGFGSIDGDFWLGNEAMHILTAKDRYELRIDFRLDDGRDVYAHYNYFKIESEDDKYRLRLGEYDGTIGEDDKRRGLSYHADMAFSTFDRDNDHWSEGHCVDERRGAWWYKACGAARLNGRWGEKTSQGNRWYTGSVILSPVYTEMKIRRL